MRCQNCRGFAPDDAERCPNCGEPLAAAKAADGKSAGGPPLIGDVGAHDGGETSEPAASPQTPKAGIYPWQEGPTDVRGGVFQQAVSWTMGHLWWILGVVVLIMVVVATSARHGVGGVMDLFWGLLAWVLAIGLMLRRGLRRLPAVVILGAVGLAFFGLGFRALTAPAQTPAGPSPVSHSAGSGLSVPGVTARTVDVTITGNQPWVATPVDLKSGEVVKITATGTINNGSIYPQVANNTPAGQGMVTSDGGCTASVTPQSGFIAPGLPCWSLIGRIGTGTPFAVGTHSILTVTTGGVLWLGVDNNAFGHSSGSWTVTIVVSHKL